MSYFSSVLVLMLLMLNCMFFIDLLDLTFQPFLERL